LATYGVVYNVFNRDNQALLFTGDPDIAHLSKGIVDCILPEYLAETSTEIVEKQCELYLAGNMSEVDILAKVAFDKYGVQNWRAEEFKKKLFLAAKQHIDYFRKDTAHSNVVLSLVYNYLTDELSSFEVVNGLAKNLLNDPLFVRDKASMLVIMALTGYSPEKFLQEYFQKPPGEKEFTIY
ncbi:MAG: hypothetical protein KKA62_02255, partial [Nanoarchaeota archaeon]|nr:hypothetical protein [Nanoarchaeota archaeon]